MTNAHPPPAPQKIDAHGQGRKVDSVHDGTPSFNGVRGLCTRFNDTELVSAGADGIIRRWDITGGSLGREMGTIRVRFPDSSPLWTWQAASMAWLSSDTVRRWLSRVKSRLQSAPWIHCRTAQPSSLGQPGESSPPLPSLCAYSSALRWTRRVNRFSVASGDAVLSLDAALRYLHHLFCLPDATSGHVVARAPPRRCCSMASTHVWTAAMTTWQSRVTPCARTNSSRRRRRRMCTTGMRRRTSLSSVPASQCLPPASASFQAIMQA